MLMTRDHGDLVGSEPSETFATAPLGGHDDAVVAGEQAHGQVLFGFVRRLGVKDAAAADVVQESLLRLFDALSAGQSISDLKSWTFHVAYRLAMDEHRRLARGLRLVHLDDSGHRGFDALEEVAMPIVESFVFSPTPPTT
jgi:DNA-directed RNA polymerase specialized sigma24 family protein